MSPENKIAKSIVDASYRPRGFFTLYFLLRMSQYKLKQAELEHEWAADHNYDIETSIARLMEVEAGEDFKPGVVYMRSGPDIRDLVAGGKAIMTTLGDMGKAAIRALVDNEGKLIPRISPASRSRESQIELGCRH